MISWVQLGHPRQSAYNTESYIITETILGRTLVIIFASMTLVHVMIAIYVRHSCKSIPDLTPPLLLSFLTARVFRETTWSLANIRKARLYAFGSCVHLRMVRSASGVLRQLLYLRDTLRIRFDRFMVQLDTPPPRPPVFGRR